MKSVEQSTLIVITNTPDRACAERIARELVGAGLAACVNILAPCTSFYRWRGALEEAQEVPLMIKTGAAQYGALETALLGLHPYELPEIVAVRVERGLPAYLEWVVEQCSTKASAP